MTLRSSNGAVHVLKAWPRSISRAHACCFAHPPDSTGGHVFTPSELAQHSTSPPTPVHCCPRICMPTVSGTTAVVCPLPFGPFLPKFGLLCTQKCTNSLILLATLGCYSAFLLAFSFPFHSQFRFSSPFCTPAYSSSRVCCRPHMAKAKIHAANTVMSPPQCEP